MRPAWVFIGLWIACGVAIVVIQVWLEAVK